MIQLEKNTQMLDLIFLVEQRTDLKLSSTNDTIKDICTEFRNLPISEIQKAFRLGALGKYGRTYKLSTQELCYWIRQYLESKNKNRLAL